MIDTLVLASANPKKIAELRVLLHGVVGTLMPRPEDTPDTVEDQDSLEGNAKKKAQEIAEVTGLPAVADDTGLFVSALAGRPGVYTARYAGPDATSETNIAKLLGELEGADDRSAAFRTVIAIVWPDGRDLLAAGEVQGQITTATQGSGGFGYDSVFAPEEAFEGSEPVTFAQMGTNAKNRISHRGRALAALKAALQT